MPRISPENPLQKPPTHIHFVRQATQFLAGNGKQCQTAVALRLPGARPAKKGSPCLGALSVPDVQVQRHPAKSLMQQRRK